MSVFVYPVVSPCVWVLNLLDSHCVRSLMSFVQVYLVFILLFRPEWKSSFLHGGGSHLRCGGGWCRRRRAEGGDRVIRAWIQYRLHHQAIPYSFPYGCSPGDLILPSFLLAFFSTLSLTECINPAC